MPVKIGGGNKLQYYDKESGEYTDEQKLDLNENDKENLVMYHYYGIDDKTIIFHFPCFKIHDSEYCEMFCIFLRSKTIIKQINPSKASYLLRYNKDRDKSLFLNALGYHTGDENLLISDIVLNTDLNSITFAGLNEWGLRVKAKTTLNNKILTSIWMINKKLEMKFVTMIPGGDKLWKK